MEGDKRRPCVFEPSAISIHSLRVEGDPTQKTCYSFCCISIHSLRVEGDLAYPPPIDLLNHFNPLPPCGGRLYAMYNTGTTMQFQSTPSVWRETGCNSSGHHWIQYFNPLPPCGGRQCLQLRRCNRQGISIHSLRVEGDAPSKTPKRLRQISIHSLRVEGDHYRSSDSAADPDFNPLPPCGGRLCPLRSPFIQSPISIHSLRVEGDNVGGTNTARYVISIHSLRVEGDRIRFSHDIRAKKFQSTPSVWRETF